MINYPPVYKNMPFQKGSEVPTTHDAMHPAKIAKIMDGNVRPIIDLYGAINASDTEVY